MVDDRLAARGEVAAGREVHQRVGAVALRPAQLLDLFVGALLDTGEAPMLALILVVIMRPMPVGSRRLGARSPRSDVGVVDHRRALRRRSGSPRARASARAPGWPIGRARRTRAGRRRCGASPPLPARWRTLAGITRRPRATSSRMSSGVAPSRSRHAPHLRGDDALPRRFELCHRASLRRNDPDQVRGVGESPLALSAAGLGRLPQRLPVEHDPRVPRRQGSAGMSSRRHMGGSGPGGQANTWTSSDPRLVTHPLPAPRSCRPGR